MPHRDGVGKRREREKQLMRLDLGPSCSERRLQPPTQFCRMERGSASDSSGPPLFSLRSHGLSRGTRCPASLLAFLGGTCTNLELFRGSASPTPPPPCAPTPAPGRRLLHRRGGCGQTSALALSESVWASGWQGQSRMRMARGGRGPWGQGTQHLRSPRLGRRQLVPTGRSGEEMPAGAPAPHRHVWG